MTCSACSIGELNFEMKVAGSRNLAMIPAIALHLKRNGRRFEAMDDGRMTLEEAGARDFYDYCSDHMDADDVYYRSQGSGSESEWLPVTALPSVLEAEWIDELIRREAVVCYYQPIVTGDGARYAYELLARFPKEDGGMRYPNEVFAAAKLRGRLYALDRLCRLTAVKYAAKLNTLAFINFIPTSIYSPEHCLQSTVALAERLGADPSRFVFEVVESERVADIDHLKRILAYYKARGFRYALDDVGEGYSTIELLDDLRPHYMKLDMKYVQGVASDAEKQDTARSFLAYALRIGSIPLAEGVETEADYEWLKREGYVLFQGYLFGKPSPTANEAPNIVY